jgi:uncharacterized C2H2 Zn-finger protein
MIRDTRCPECGQMCVGENGTYQHIKRVHGMKAARRFRPGLSPNQQKQAERSA